MPHPEPTGPCDPRSQNEISAGTAFDRRSFLRTFAIGSATCVLGNQLWTGRALGQILNGPAGILKIRLSEFPVLQSVGGSVRLTYSWYASHPIMINRGAGNAFYAVDTECQHLSCVVNEYDYFSNEIRCGCHNSLYAIDGSLLQGPALRGLNTFLIGYDGVDTLSVTIPGLKFSVTNIAVQRSGPPLRLRLTFDILPNSRYRVYYQEELTAAPQIIPFATTPTGAATITSASSRARPTTIYVDSSAPRGFFTVALVAEPYS